MEFNSTVFLFAFLPLAWVGFRIAAAAAGRRAAVIWLILASLTYYGWWNWRYVVLLLLSLLVNLNIGRSLLARPAGRRRPWLLAGLVWNLGLLGYYKYRNFFLETAAAVGGTSFDLGKLFLPLGISFFTFQLIGFLVDAHRGRVKSVDAAEFVLFILYFPQLIAGPIVHHADFIPQLRKPGFGRVSGREFALGLAVFSAGLFQKCVIADTLAPLADSGFGLVATGTDLRLQEAWVALAAYAAQLFNDFSGYSHMAIGVALLFGLRLPVNFMAPYTAGSLIEFWRRWHITLSAFLRDYVYVPLGGNRHRHLANLFLTMFLAGLWHGAGWTFVLWGVWHGAAICVNHAWRSWRGWTQDTPSPVWAHVLTLLVVVAGWTLFRAPSLSVAREFAMSLVGVHGISVPVSLTGWVQSLAPVVRPRGLFEHLPASPTVLIVLALSIYFACRGPRLLAFFGVTTGDVIALSSRHRPELASPGMPLSWARVCLSGVMFAVAIATLARTSTFLYYQF